MAGTKTASRDHHPSHHIIERGTKSAGKPRSTRSLVLPTDENNIELDFSGRKVKLTNLRKLFWLSPRITKRDLLQYYIDISKVLLPHLQDRAMVMKRYPNGAAGEFFFMKHAPESRPGWIEICSIEHGSGNIIDFVIIQDLPSLLWTVNLGCIDLNQWYARCDDVDRPDYLHFDLDPVPGASFARVRDAALLVRAALQALNMPCHAKTTGSKGIHIYVPIVRGPNQKEVWTFAKEIAHVLEAHDPKLITAEYAVAKRPKGRILVDYNQNAWGRTLASVYSVRPKPLATVSTPVSWNEIEKGIKIEDFRLDNVPQRVRKLGDLWKPLLQKRGRFRLDAYL